LINKTCLGTKAICFALTSSAGVRWYIAQFPEKVFNRPVGSLPLQTVGSRAVLPHGKAQHPANILGKLGLRARACTK